LATGNLNFIKASISILGELNSSAMC